MRRMYAYLKVIVLQRNCISGVYIIDCVVVFQDHVAIRAGNTYTSPSADSECFGSEQVYAMSSIVELCHVGTITAMTILQKQNRF